MGDGADSGGAAASSGGKAANDKDVKPRHWDGADSGGAAASSGGKAANDRDVKPRRWVSQLVTQKTLSGEMVVRKWVTDQLPTISVDHVLGDSQPQFCPLEGCGKAFADVASLRKHSCGKAFADAASLRKHMHTHIKTKILGETLAFLFQN